MGIGLGIVLIVIGAILLFALNLDIPWVSDDTLGIILILAGFLTLALALILNYQRGEPSMYRRAATTGRRQPSDPHLVICSAIEDLLPSVHGQRLHQIARYRR